MSEFPIPRPDELLPMLPGACLGAGLGWLAARVPARGGGRAALITLAAIAPWWTTWAWTHGGSPPLGTGSASERAATLLPLFVVALVILPTRGWRGGLAIACRLLVGAAMGAGVLATFLDPAHPHAVGALDLALVGVATAALTTPVHLAATRLRAPAMLLPVSASLAAFGLLLLAVGSAAALSQVVAATALAAGLAALGARLFGPGRMPAALPVAWLAAGLAAGVDAWRTAAEPLPTAPLVLLGAALWLPTLAALAPLRRARELRVTVACVGIGGVLAAAAVAVAIVTTPAEPEAAEDDPYAGYETFR